MKKTVELNQRFIVLEAECNSVLCSFPFAPCRIEEIHRCQKTPVLFFAIFYYHKQCLIIPWSTRCAILREAFNDSILTNRLEAKTEKEKYTVFCRCRQSVCVLLLLLLFCWIYQSNVFSACSTILLSFWTTDITVTFPLMHTFPLKNTSSGINYFKRFTLQNSLYSSESP